MIKTPRPILNGEELNYDGEAFAVVVAQTPYQAQDAAEQVAGELEPLPGVGDVTTATAEGAPRVHVDMDSNISRRKTVAFGDVEGALGPNSVTAKIRLTTARVAGAARDAPAVTAAPDDETAGPKVRTATQHGVGER